MHPSAKKPYQESAAKRVPHPLAKRIGQWRNRHEYSQRFALSQDNSYSMAKARNNVRHGPQPISDISEKIQHQKRRFLWLLKPGKPLTLCYELPVYNIMPPNKTVS
ncbi:hypothetical protein AVEN_262567-1 [Araneus ventricosus]|uniref:Uncharacterized protein n=1 Tax=Araneus ventricosus TaxID=182803 RepID=A0A4Y2TEY8_ARAVE|nr:hypothetical protein AVEN_262567-1 [Araneus ventricosus]